MPSFLDRLNEAKSRAAQDVEVPTEDPYDRVLRDFATWLMNSYDGVEATVGRGDRPELWYLMTGPMYRRHERSIMLSFWRTGDGLQNPGREPEMFTTPEDLEAYLVHFVENPDFQFSLEEYGRRSKQDLSGSLRQRGLDTVWNGDAIVLVRNDEHRKLASAEPGKVVTLAVTADEDLPLDSSRYHYLSSAGYGMDKIKIVTGAHGGLEVTGRVMEPGRVK
jgi:hypothetical protein